MTWHRQPRPSTGRTHAALWAGLYSAGLPLGTTVGFAVLMVVWPMVGLPTGGDMVGAVLNWFDTYGYWAVLVGSVVEGLVMVNLYLPGSLVIVLGVASHSEDPVGALAVVGVSAAGFVLSGVANYGVGYFGWARVVRALGGGRWLDEARTRYRRWGPAYLAVSYVHPNIGGFVAVVCGTARLDPSTFLPVLLCSVLFWNVMWGAVVYRYADLIQLAVGDPRAVLCALGLWTVVSFLVGVVRLRARDAT